MESETFQIRISKLIQKSRKAVRLYSSVNCPTSSRRAEFTDYQISEWKEINTLLLQGLVNAMDVPSKKGLVSDVYALRDRFLTLWNAAETELESCQKKLLKATQERDYIRVATLSCQLISLKARVQAAQAAHHEIQSILDKSHVVRPTVELSQEIKTSDDQKAANEEESSNVIPLHRRRA